MTAPLLPAATPMSVAKWAFGSVVIVIFALVVLQLLAQRGYNPVAYIAGMVPMPAPTPGANGSTSAGANAGAAALA